MEIPLLKDIIIILGLGIFVLFLFSRLRIPPIVGYLLTGVIAGPYGTALVKAVHEVDVLAHIGVILLLFTIGIEFSLEKLFHLKKEVVWGGGIQIVSTSVVTISIASLLGLPLTQAVFWGFLISLSSTAIVLKLLQEKAAIETPAGRTTVGILIAQDVMIVPMMLITPLLAGRASSDITFTSFLIKITLLLIFLFISHRWLVPFILHQIARTRNRELFLTTVAFLAFAIAGLTSLIGLSLALGAFLAGLIISESEYSHNAFALILPLRDIFIGFFFVSIGMLLNIQVIFNNPLAVLGIFAGIIVIKLLTGILASILTGHSLRTSLLVGFALAQVGEFSFILSKTGIQFGLLTDTQNQLFLAGSVLTMMVTPFIIAPLKLIDLILKVFPFLDRFRSRKGDLASASTLTELNDHLIIIGYGLNGRNLSSAAQSAGIPFIIVEFNPDVVNKEKKSGIPIFYGDAVQPEVLKMAGIQQARILVIAINDATATRRIIDLAHRTNPNLYIIVRTRFVQDVPELYKLGASEVIPEEFETSIEIFTRVLKKYMTPEDKITELTSEIRADGYEMLRKPGGNALPLENLAIPDVEVSVVQIPEKSTFIGKSVFDLQIRQKYGGNVLVIYRSGQVLTEIRPDMKILPGDRLLILGKPGDITRIQRAIGGSTMADH